MEFGNPDSQDPTHLNYVIKNAIVSDGISNWKRGDMRFVLNNEENNNDYNIANDTRMIIKTDGKVGIGTTSPSAKLHVEGNARITSMSGGGTSD